jgi:hypothetical protein
MIKTQKIITNKFIAHRDNTGIAMLEVRPGWDPITQTIREKRHEEKPGQIRDNKNH